MKDKEIKIRVRSETLEMWNKAKGDMNLSEFLREAGNIKAYKMIKYKRTAEIRAKYQAKAPVKQIGRNEPCLCGSGKKFKKCCLNNVGTSAGTNNEVAGEEEEG